MTSPHPQATQPGKTSYQNLLAEITKLTADLQVLREQTIDTLAPVVQDLVSSRDVQRMEHTLDQLLDVACLPDGLSMFKALCRHYWGLDQQATAAYVHAYREMWEDDDQTDGDEVQT